MRSRAQRSACSGTAPSRGKAEDALEELEGMLMSNLARYARQSSSRASGPGPACQSHMARCGSRPSGSRSTVTWIRVPGRSGSSFLPANQPRSPWMRGRTSCQASAGRCRRAGYPAGRTSRRVPGSAAGASSGRGGRCRRRQRRSPRAPGSAPPPRGAAGGRTFPPRWQGRHRTRSRPQPDQHVDRAAQEPVGEGGGAVAGVEDEQRRRLPAVPGGAQPPQHALHLRDRLRRPGRGHGARHVGQGGPCGAQVPDRGGELVLPAGRGLGRPFAVARAVVHVLPAR